MRHIEAWVSYIVPHIADDDDDDDDKVNVGMWVGIALAIIIVLALIVLVLIFVLKKAGGGGETGRKEMIPHSVSPSPLPPKEPHLIYEHPPPDYTWPGKMKHLVAFKFKSHLFIVKYQTQYSAE